jgi:hypothetical protein
MSRISIPQAETTASGYHWIHLDSEPPFGYNEREAAEISRPGKHDMKSDGYPL